MIEYKGQKEDYYQVDYNLKLYHWIFEKAGLLHKLEYANGVHFDLTKEDIMAIDIAQQEINEFADVIQAAAQKDKDMPLEVKIKQGVLIKLYADRCVYIPKGHKDYDISDFEEFDSSLIT